ARRSGCWPRTRWPGSPGKSRRRTSPLVFLVALVIDGARAGVMYAPAALAFVVVYKASRVMNFALGEWLMLGSRLVATGIHALGVGFIAAVGGSATVMVGTALVFSRIVLRRMVGHPPIALIMITIGLGALMRGSAAIVFSGIPSGITLPMPTDPLIIRGVPIAADKLAAAAVSAVAIVAVSMFFRVSRTGVALRAIAD